MRKSPADIRKLLYRLAKAWEKTPEMRLGQLLSNANHWPFDGAIFYAEDEDLLSRVEKYVTRVSQHDLLA